MVGAVRIGLQGQPGIGLRIRFEILRHDTGHGERPFVQQNSSSQNPRVAAEAALPDAVGENRGARPVGLVFRAVEDPAQSGHSAKDLEEPLGDMQALDLNGRLPGSERLVDPHLVVQRSLREYLVVAPSHVFGDGDRGVVIAARIGLAQAYQAIRLPKR